MSKDIHLGDRGSVRRHLLLYLEVLDADTEQPLGRLGDIHETGILLLSKQPLETGSVYTVHLSIPKTVDPERGVLTLPIEVRWCRTDTRPDMYAIGCSITSLEEEERAYIETLIDRIGFSDGTRRIFLKNDRNVFSDIDVTEE